MSNTKTIIEYSAEEFKEKIKTKMFTGKRVEVEYVIGEIGRDPLDRVPGRKGLTKVLIKIDGDLLEG